MFKKFLMLTLAVLFSLGQMWGEEVTCTVTSSTGTTSPVTINNVSWTFVTTNGTGSPSITNGNAYSARCLKFGTGANNCYSKITFSTDYFKNNGYVVSAVEVNALGSAAKNVTIGVGSTTETKSVAANSWTKLSLEDLNVTETLSIDFSLNGAGFFINYIKVTYTSGTPLAPASHKVYFSANGTILNAGGTSVTEGASITFPSDPAGEGSKAFVGWVSSPIVGTTDTKPAFADKDATTMGGSDVTFYAVYAAVDGAAFTTSISGIDGFTSGNYYLVEKFNDTYYAMSGVVGANTSSAVDATAISGVTENADGTITLSTALASTCVYTLTKGSTGSNTTAEIKNVAAGDNNQWVGGYTSNNANLNTNKTAWTITASGKVYRLYTYSTRSLFHGSYTAFKNYAETSAKIFLVPELSTSYSGYCTSVVTRTISSIAVKTAPSLVDYCEGEKFNPAGLVITVNYTEGDPDDVAYTGHESSFSFVPALDAALAATDNKVTITYKGETCDQAISVRTVSISAPTTVEGTYTVKVGEADEVTADGTTIAAKKGQKIVLASTAATGYRVRTTPFVVTDEDGASVSVSKAGGINSFTMPGKNVTITAQFSKLYTLTAAAMTNGSIAIKWNDAVATEAVKGNKIVVDVLPSEHYHLTSLYYVKENVEGQTTITATDNVYSFTMEDANTTIYATFAEDEYHNVIFSVNGEESEPVKVYTGEAVTFPTKPADIAGKKFQGWAKEEIEGTTETKPTMFATEIMGSDDIEFYAVFAEEEDDSATEDISMSATSITQNGITVATATADGNNDPLYTSSELRIYVGNTITISSDKDITSMSLTFHKQGSKNYISTVSANVGTYTSGGTSSDGEDDKTDTWTGSAKSITLSTSGGAQRVFVSASVTVGSISVTAYCTTLTPVNQLAATGKANWGEGETYTTNTAKDNHGTICLPYDAVVTGAVVYRFVERVSDGLVFDFAENSAENSNIVYAGKAYVYYATGETQYWTRTSYGAEDVDAENDGLLVGTYSQIELAEGQYFLYSGDDMFHPAGLAVGETEHTFVNVPAFRAYVPNMPMFGGAPVRMIMPKNGVATGVENVADYKAAKAIVDGKLVIIRGAKTYTTAGAMMK